MTANHPRRVLIAITDSNIGGAEKIVSLLARRLDRKRFLPTVCSLKPVGVAGRALEAAGVEVVSLGFGGGLCNAPVLVPRMLSVIRSRRIELVHSFLFLANMTGRVAARLAGVPEISSIRVEERQKRYHLTLERLTRGLVRAWLVPSQRIADFAVTRSRLDPARIVIVPNAVEAPLPAQPLLRARFLARPGPLLGFVGRLHRQKGVDILLAALRELPPELPWHLAIVGDGPERRSLEGLVRDLGLIDRVVFTGWMPPSAVGELDLLVLPSRWEGLPNVLLEAMAAGVPVIASRTGGVGEVVENGRTGFLVAPDDAVALADLLGRFIRGGLDAAGVAERARAQVLEEHRPEMMVESVEALYDRVLGERR